MSPRWEAAARRQQHLLFFLPSWTDRTRFENRKGARLSPSTVSLLIGTNARSSLFLRGETPSSRLLHAGARQVLHFSCTTFLSLLLLVCFSSPARDTADARSCCISMDRIPGLLRPAGVCPPVTTLPRDFRVKHARGIARWFSWTHFFRLFSILLWIRSLRS